MGGLKIVSGGQTGVDRAALDAARELRLETGGWCPRGRRAEDGVIPDCYPLQETASRSYSVRTDWNVRDSDGTLVVVLDDISSGTRLTIAAAHTWQKPLYVVHLDPDPEPGLLGRSYRSAVARDQDSAGSAEEAGSSGRPESAENSADQALTAVVDWIRRHKIRVLNVAGPRGSSSGRIYPQAHMFLARLFQMLSTSLPETAELAAATTRARRKRSRNLDAGSRPDS